MSIEDKKIKENIMGTLICDRKKFTDTTEIVSYMTDKQSLAFPSSILKFFQEIANSHCEEFNLGFESLSEKNVTFLLVNVSMDIIRTPKLHEKIKITTWSVGKKGIRYIRRTIIEDMNGEIICQAESVWVLADIIGHKIITKGDEIGFCLPDCDDVSGELRCGKIRQPDDMCLQGKRLIRYTDIDYNGHLNNCKYADFIIDFMPFNMTGKRVSKLDIYFHSEAMEGEKIEIYTKECDGFVYFHGKKGDTVCFDARCEVAVCDRS